MLEREALISGLEGEDRYLVGSFIDLCERVQKTHEPEFSDFTDPRQNDLCCSVLNEVSGLRGRSFGGYRGAERCRICVYPDYYLPELLPEGISILEIRPHREETGLGHRHYLGSIMGLGVKREKVGDLIVTEHFCHAVVAREMSEFLLLELNEVDRFKVEVSEVDPEKIASRKPPREVFSTVASMRLDAVASAGFGTSRTRMARAIKQGLVKVNWQIVSDPAQDIEAEDVISMRGRGRVEIAELQGRSNKGRIKLVLNRYT